jgi:hypothetical protein
LDRALQGQHIDFVMQDFSRSSLPAYEPLKVELYHELVFRLLSRAIGGEPNFNLKVDAALVQEFPGLQQLYFNIFGGN